MVGTPLLIGPAEQEQLRGLRARAVEHPVDMPRLAEEIKTRQGKRRHIQQMQRQTVYLPAAYAVTLSIEVGHPGGTARHMSMSVRRADRIPNEHAVWMVAAELGFTGSSVADCDRAWLEDLSDGGTAVNIVQLLQAEAGRA